MENEAKLIKQLIDGSEDAFDKIYHIYSQRLFGYCMSYTKSRDNAEDIVQEVFIKLWNSRLSIKSDTSLGAYIFTIAKNHIINIYRQRVNSPIYEEYVNYCNSLKISADDTINLIEYDDFITRLNKALQKLSKTQRAVFQYCKIEQLSGKNAAKKLDISEQTVKNQLSLAIKSLRSTLKYIPIWAAFFLK